MKDCFDITGKVALVTGASSGLGAEFSKILAYRGADVVMLARRKEKLEKMAEEVRQYGHKVLPITCDVTDKEQVQAAVDQAVKVFSKIDILVNNAGTCEVLSTAELTEESWHKVIDVNLEAVVFMTKYVVPI